MHLIYLPLKQYLHPSKSNASNNDTMAERLETLHAEAGLEFDTQEARLRCMPHR
jgi:hypothetical protein